MIRDRLEYVCLAKPLETNKALIRIHVARHARVACAKLRGTGRSQRGLGSTGLLPNVDVQHGLFRFLKSKLSGFYSFDRNPPASPKLGEGRAD